MKKASIHQTPEDRLAQNTESSVSAIKETTRKVEENTHAVKELKLAIKDKSLEAAGFEASVRAQKETTRKVEEVKSLGKVSNTLLKKIAERKDPEPVKIPEFPAFPTQMDMTLKGVSLVTIKGDKGDKGEKGEKGDRGEKGESIQGPQGETGKQGPKGDKGDRGEAGKNGLNGENGTDGKNGSPDSPDDVVDKLNSSKKIIDAERIRGLAEAFTQIERFGTNPNGATGGGPTYRFLDAGTLVSEHVTEINFGDNLTVTYDLNGRVTVNAAAGGSGSPGGSDTQLQYNNAGAFGGITGATTNGTSVTLAAATLTGLTTFTGATSGTTTLRASNIAGTTALVLPAANDTLMGRATTDIMTGKTFDANAAGNSLSNVEVADLAGSAVVTAAEGVASSDNDTSLPTTAAVIDAVAAGVGLKDQFGITVDGGGSAIATGQKGFFRVPFNCSVTGWTIVSDVSGSCVIDIWKDTYANFPPLVADSVAGSEKPTLSSAQKNEDLSLSTWTDTTWTEGDIIAYNVDSATTVTRVTMFIHVTRS